MVRARRRSQGEMFEWEKRESWFDGPRETGTPCHLSGDRLYRLARLDRHRLLTAGKAHKYAWVARWKSISSYSLAAVSLDGRPLSNDNSPMRVFIACMLTPPSQCQPTASFDRNMPAWARRDEIGKPELVRSGLYPVTFLAAGSLWPEIQVHGAVGVLLEFRGFRGDFRQ